MVVTYEPPRSDLPSGVLTGTVYGNITRAIDDGPDPDIKTDTVPAVGLIRFTPSTPYISYGESLIILEVRHALVEPNGDFEIELISTDISTPVVNWKYRVDFFVGNITLPSFDIQVPPYSAQPLNDALPILTQPSHVVVKGDKGDKGDLGIAGLGVYVDGDNDLAINDTDAVLWGTGNPNGQSLFKPKGHLYIDRDGTNSEYIFLKTTSTGSQSGWIPVTHLGGPDMIDWSSGIAILES